MLKILIGAEAFRAGMDLYLKRCDGTAATIEDFLACFAETSGRDLDHFSLWYRQAGTPSLLAKGRYDAQAKTYTLDLAQTTPPTPGQRQQGSGCDPHPPRTYSRRRDGDAAADR